MGLGQQEDIRMKTNPVVVALGLWLMSGLIPALAATVQPYEPSAFEVAQKQGDPILLFVDASWCPTCASERSVLRRLYGMPEFENLRVFDVDFDTSKPLLRRLHVQMQSTLIVYHGTRETGRLTGATNPRVIQRLLETSST
jgi:thioredoxin